MRSLLGALLIVPGLLTGCTTEPERVEPWILWSVSLSSTGSAPAIAPDGTAYIGLWGGGGVIGVDATGSVIRNLAPSDAVIHPPSIDALGRIYFGSEAGYVYAYASNGDKLWEFHGGGRFRSSPSIAADGTIIVGCEDEHIYAINNDGTQKWAYDVGSRPFADPVIGVDGTIYIGSFSGEFHAVNPDGTRLWVTDVGGLPVGIAIDNQDYLCMMNGDDLIRLPPDGSNATIYAGSADSPPVIGPDGTHYYRGGNVIYAIGVWSCVTPTNTIAMPLVAADGTVYSGFEAVSSDGQLLWSMGKVARAASALYNGRLYVVSNEPAFYAIEVSSQNLADGIWPKYKKDLRNTGRK